MDVLLNKLFEPERWEYAINKGMLKGIKQTTLRQLTSPSVRIELKRRIENGTYDIAPPHQALIPKDNGEFRTVYVNEDMDRIFLSITNDLLFEMFGKDMIHKSCTSYQKGLSCASVVTTVSKVICNTQSEEFGWKSDLTKYFDSVPIRYIDAIFDVIEDKAGKSAVIDVLRKYYHTDLTFDTDGNLISRYQSLKQGCAVASFLADSILYHIDKKLSELNGFYIRYSDDCLFVGKDYKLAMRIMVDELNQMDMTLNPKKVEYLNKHKYFKFLGFSIRGQSITLSKSRIKSYQKEIESCTIDLFKTHKKKEGESRFDYGARLKRIALNKVNRYLYKGNGKYAWASQILKTINVEEDIQELNKFAMDAIRAVECVRTNIGGLGYEPDKNKKVGCITRGTGKNVTANRENTAKHIDGYYPLGMMRNAIKTRRAAYDTLVRGL